MRLLPAHPAIRLLAASVGIQVVVVGVGIGSRVATQPSTKPPRPVVLGLRPSQVRGVAVESSTGGIELVRSREGVWSVSHGSFPESQVLMSSVEDRLLPLGAYRSLRANTSSPAYGLARPEITIRVRDVKGTEHRVELGAPTFTTGGFYARVETEPGRVYLVPRRMMDDLRSLLAGRRIDAPNDLPQKARQIREQREQAEKISWWLRQALEARAGRPKASR